MLGSTRLCVVVKISHMASQVCENTRGHLVLPAATHKYVDLFPSGRFLFLVQSYSWMKKVKSCYYVGPLKKVVDFGSFR